MFEEKDIALTLLINILSCIADIYVQFLSELLCCVQFCILVEEIHHFILLYKLS